MSWGNNGPYSVTVSDGGHGQYSSYTVGYVGEGGGGGSKHDAAAGGGKKVLAPSRLKKAGSGHDVDHYPSSYAYGADNNHHHNGGYDNHRGGYDGYGSSPYSSGGGYNKNGDSYSSYGVGTYGGAGGGAAIPYNAPGTYWSPAPQDGATRSPMFISTKEVNVYAMPGSSQYGGGGYSNDQKRRGGGFFRPALEAIGRFFDRKLGFHDRD